MSSVDRGGGRRELRGVGLGPKGHVSGAAFREQQELENILLSCYTGGGL
jgi:hypothetical protein